MRTNLKKSAAAAALRSVSVAIRTVRHPRHQEWRRQQFVTQSANILQASKKTAELKSGGEVSDKVRQGEFEEVSTLSSSASQFYFYFKLGASGGSKGSSGGQTGGHLRWWWFTSNIKCVCSPSVTLLKRLLLKSDGKNGDHWQLLLKTIQFGFVICWLAGSSSPGLTWHQTTTSTETRCHSQMSTNVNWRPAGAHKCHIYIIKFVTHIWH